MYSAEIKTSDSKTLSIEASSDFNSNLSFLLTAANNQTKYLLQWGKLCVGTVKSIHYSEILLLLIAGFIIAGIVSASVTVIDCWAFRHFLS